MRFHENDKAYRDEPGLSSSYIRQIYSGATFKNQLYTPKHIAEGSLVDILMWCMKNTDEGVNDYVNIYEGNRPPEEVANKLKVYALAGYDFHTVPDRLIADGDVYKNIKKVSTMKERIEPFKEYYNMCSSSKLLVKREELVDISKRLDVMCSSVEWASRVRGDMYDVQVPMYADLPDIGRCKSLCDIVSCPHDGIMHIIDTKVTGMTKYQWINYYAYYEAMYYIQDYLYTLIARQLNPTKQVEFTFFVLAKDGFMAYQFPESVLISMFEGFTTTEKRVLTTSRRILDVPKRTIGWKEAVLNS